MGRKPNNGTHKRELFVHSTASTQPEALPSNCACNLSKQVWWWCARALLLQRSVSYARQVSVSGGPAPADAQVFYVVKGKCPLRGARRGYGKEVCPFHIVQRKCRASVRRLCRNFHVTHFQVANVTQVKAERRRHTEHTRFGILALGLGQLNRRSRRRRTAHAFDV